MRWRRPVESAQRSRPAADQVLHPTHGTVLDGTAEPTGPGAPAGSTVTTDTVGRPQQNRVAPAAINAAPPAGSPRSPLAATTRFVIPAAVLTQTLEVLQRAGRDGNEAFVTWGGLVVEEGTTLKIVSAVVPAQRAHQTADGLLVTVDGQSLFEVNRVLYERGEVLAAQVHSHPQGAYHSSTDDCFSLVTLTGALSVVVPRFGADGLNSCRGWAWYRMTGQGQWALLGSRDQVQIVHEDAI